MEDEHAPRGSTQLIGAWLHAHEQDADGALVYVRTGTPLPPSRGRTGLTFAADGSVRRTRPGPTDRPEAHEGTWRMIGARLQLHLADGSQVTYLADASPEHLVLRPDAGPEENL